MSQEGTTTMTHSSVQPRRRTAKAPVVETVAAIDRPECPRCFGTGLVDGGFKYRKTCQACNGTKFEAANV